jgi:RNA polymerase sigma factor (sigma-70 family)
MRPVREHPSKGMPIVGNPRAFEAFYLGHFDRVTSFIARRVADPHEVADLTAEVFVAVLASAAAYRAEKGSETAWLYGIAHNVVREDRRRRTRRRTALERAGGRALLKGDDVADLIDHIDTAAPARAAMRALAGLPAKQRTVIELVAIDQLTLTEAAAALRISVGTARVRLHRARKALAQVPEVASLVTTSAVTEGLS